MSLSAEYLEVELLFILCSVAERQSLITSREQWVDWFLQRLQQEPWALGGLVVMGVFVLGTLSLVLFALLFGCCSHPNEGKQRQKKQQKESKNAVI